MERTAAFLAEVIVCSHHAILMLCLPYIGESYSLWKLESIIVHVTRIFTWGGKEREETPHHTYLIDRVDTSFIYRY